MKPNINSTMCKRLLNILFILLIGAIGVQTITSCSGDDNDDGDNGNNGGAISSSSSVVGNGGGGTSSSSGDNVNTTSGTWTKADFPFGEPGGWLVNAVAYGNDKFVAVAESNVNGAWGAIAYSPNGINWTEVEDHPFDNYISSVTYANGKFVAVGLSGSDGNSGRIAYSTNGINWTSVHSADQHFSDIVYGGGKFVAVGDAGLRAYSTDGVNWANADDQHFDIYNAASVAYGDGVFIAVGTTSLMSYSADGTAWNGLGIPFSSYPNLWLSSIAYGNDKFIVGADMMGLVAYSTNKGESWTELSEKPFGSSNITALMYDGNKFIVGTNKGQIGYSANGIAWDILSMQETTFISGISPIIIEDIGYNGTDTYVAVGQGRIAYLINNNQP